MRAEAAGGQALLRARAQLAAWREDGADRLDPMRFALIEALAARAERHEGRARALLEARLDGLLADYREALASTSGGLRAASRPSVVGLRGVLDALAESRASRVSEAVYPMLPALEEFRRLWTQVLGERQLRQSLRSAPVDAGPLNSSVLVHRAVALMREVSPDYLRHFLAYADNLAWLERLHEAGQRGAASAGAAASGPRKSRKRRG